MLSYVSYILIVTDSKLIGLDQRRQFVIKLLKYMKCIKSGPLSKLIYKFFPCIL